MNHLPIKIILLLFSISASCQLSFSQGCSDAGFCTMGAMRPDQNFSKKLDVRLRSVEIGQYYGYSKFEDKIFSTSLDLNFGLSSKWTFQIKLPYTIVIGNLKNTQGFGDFSLSLTYQLIAKERFQISLTAGAKVPTSDANNIKSDGLTLPMYYQTSLGTYDFVFGASLITKNWLLAVGYQQPLTSIKNNFNRAEWVNSPLRSVANEYPISNQLTRKADFMLRIERNFRFSRFNAHLGILNLYRFEKDEVVSFATGEYVKVDDSEGLVINILGGLGYRLNTRNSVKFIGGYGAIKRDRNPDGLSREFVFTLGYQYVF